MGVQGYHLARAAEARKAAETLRADQPGWALVPLFYSAMHVMHARFDADELPSDERHPIVHKSHREAGRVAWWGTADVVRARYPHVSPQYTSLSSASYATRYGEPPRGDGQRLWDEYEQLTAAVAG